MRTGACWLALAALIAAAPAVARPLAPAPPTQAQTQAAEAACKAQGLTPATDAFRQCVGKALAAALGGGGGQGTSAPPPGAQAAEAACKAKGLSPGSDAFNQCVKAFAAAAAAADAASKHPSQTGTAAQQAAVAACKAKGLAVDSEAFKECLKDETSSGPAAPNASDQAAIDGCKASGVPQRTDAFKACVLAASAAASISGWTGEQLAAVNVCKAQGIAFPSAAFSACLSKVLTKLIPGKGQPAGKEVGAAVAACAAKKLTGSALTDCVKAQLNG